MNRQDRAFTERNAVDRATGLLMELRGLTELEATDVIKQMATDRNIPIEEVASKLISLNDRMA